MLLLKLHTSHLTPQTTNLTPQTSHLKPHTSLLTPHSSLLTTCAPHLALFRFSIGDDFQWEAALEPFSLWDELIDAVNADGRVRVQYSTLAE